MVTWSATQMPATIVAFQACRGVQASLPVLYGRHPGRTLHRLLDKLLPCVRQAGLRAAAAEADAPAERARAAGAALVGAAALPRQLVECCAGRDGRARILLPPAGACTSRDLSFCCVFLALPSNVNCCQCQYTVTYFVCQSTGLLALISCCEAP